MLAFEISHCKHEVSGGVNYSVSIATEDVHTSHDVISWDHKPGHQSQYNVFGLQTDDLKALGQALIQEALKIELEEKHG